MAFGRFDSQQSAPLAEMNTTPLVDVMLVLLVVFMLAAPLLQPTVPIALPQAHGKASAPKPHHLNISLDQHGQLFWDKEVISETTLAQRLKARLETQPDLVMVLRADKDCRYEVVAQIMASAKQAGVTRLGLATDQPQD